MDQHSQFDPYYDAPHASGSNSHTTTADYELQDYYDDTGIPVR